MLAKSYLMEELGPVSSNLRQVAEIGLEAAGYLEHRKKATDAWRAKRLTFLQQAAQPQAVLIDMMVPAVTKLVQATQTQ